MTWATQLYPAYRFFESTSVGVKYCKLKNFHSMVSKYFIPTNCTTIITNENAPHWCSINPRFLGIVLQWICSNKRIIFLIFQFREFSHLKIHFLSMVSIWTCIFPFHWFHQMHEIYIDTCERNQSKQIVINVGKIGRIHSNGFHKKTLFDCVTHPNQFVVLSTRFVYNSTEGLLKFQCMKCVTNISVRKTLYMCDSICTKKVGRDNLNWWSINMISNLNHFWYVVRSILSMKCNEIRRDEYFISELDRTSGPGAQSYAYPLTQKHPYIFSP